MNVLHRIRRYGNMATRHEQPNIYFSNPPVMRAPSSYPQQHMNQPMSFTSDPSAFPQQYMNLNMSTTPSTPAFPQQHVNISTPSTSSASQFPQWQIQHTSSAANYISSFNPVEESQQETACDNDDSTSSIMSLQ